MKAEIRLVKYEAARHALQVARSVDEVKNVRDKAQAAALYARQANDTELIDIASEIKLRAERRAGEMLKEMREQDARQKPGGGYQTSNATMFAPALKDLGISRDESSQWQRVAEVPEKAFEGYLKKNKTKRSTADLLKRCHPGEARRAETKKREREQRKQRQAEARAEAEQIWKEAVEGPGPLPGNVHALKSAGTLEQASQSSRIILDCTFRLWKLRDFLPEHFDPSDWDELMSCLPGALTLLQRLMERGTYDQSKIG
jgi:hypothetical protein